MTVIELHPHKDIGWVSWRGRYGFGRVHLENTDQGVTLCGAEIPPPSQWSRVVRNQKSADLDTICRSCLKEYATHH